MEVFVGSSAFVSLRNPLDVNHEIAKSVAAQLERAQTPLVTSNFIVAESLTVIAQRVSLAKAVEFREVFLPGVRVVSITEEIEEVAFDIFKRLTSKNVSFIDCTSFALMRELGVKTAFAFDDHFKHHGFRLLGAGR